MPHRGTSNEYPQHMISLRNMENYPKNITNFSFLTLLIHVMYMYPQIVDIARILILFSPQNFMFKVVGIANVRFEYLYNIDKPVS